MSWFLRLLKVVLTIALLAVFGLSVWQTGARTPPQRWMITLESGPPKAIDGFEPRRSAGRQQLNQRRETSMKANGSMQLN
jgi:hypothetical protein